MHRFIDLALHSGGADGYLTLRWCELSCGCKGLIRCAFRGRGPTIRTTARTEVTITLGSCYLACPAAQLSWPTSRPTDFQLILLALLALPPGPWQSAVAQSK